MQLRDMTAASGGRRSFLGKAALGGLGLAGLGLPGRQAWAETTTLPLPGGPGEREVTTAFPHKEPMILALVHFDNLKG